MNSSELLRVYGSLMWSLSRVIPAPEAIRVFVGSFWDQPLKETDTKALLQSEEAELLATLRSLPKSHSIRLVNEQIKRAKQLKTHILIINQLKSNFGFFSRNAKVQEKILQEDELIAQFKKVQTDYNIPVNDFPKFSAFKETIQTMDISKFPDLDKKRIEKLDWLIQQGIPNLLRTAQNVEAQQLQAQQQQLQASHGSSAPPGYDDAVADSLNPFADDAADVMPGAPWSVPGHLQAKYRAFAVSDR
eukprot:UN02549